MTCCGSICSPVSKKSSWTIDAICGCFPSRDCVFSGIGQFPPAARINILSAPSDPTQSFNTSRINLLWPLKVTIPTLRLGNVSAILRSALKTGLVWTESAAADPGHRPYVWI